jgi:hypothetical protein
VARLLLILLAACRCVAHEPPPAPATTSSPSTAPAARLLGAACEASALARWGDGLLVGDNETKDHLFLYGPDGALRDRPALGVEVEDIESLVPAGSSVWVIGSQGRKKSGEEEPGRRRMTFWPGGTVITPDLSACAPCAAAAGRGPEDGGINVEGGFLWSGHLWVGLRSPLVDGKALLLELDEPAQGPGSLTPGVLRTVAIDLGGYGVRDITPVEGGLLVVAGPADGAAATHRLYQLVSPDQPPARLPLDLPPSAEGITDNGDGTLTWVADGDGKKEQCKEPSTWGTARYR